MFSFFPKERQFLDTESQQRVVNSIKEAEVKTTGEIRVFMEPRCKYMDALDRAKEIFARLKMEQTVERNATIIYIAFADKQFALFGDMAIYEKAGGADFWKKAADILSSKMRNGEYTEGLCNCINELGKALAAHFPPNPTINKNELPDEIVFGK
jgi:uncharacterized membrane protein